MNVRSDLLDDVWRGRNCVFAVAVLGDVLRLVLQQYAPQSCQFSIRAQVEVAMGMSKEKPS